MHVFSEEKVKVRIGKIIQEFLQISKIPFRGILLEAIQKIVKYDLFLV